MPIFYFRIEAIPTMKHDEFDDIGGAYINCWVKSSDENKAFKIASKTLAKYFWKILKTEKSFVATADMYKNIPESLECFNEAMQGGESYYFYEWPNEPQKDDIIH